jgi:pyruvate formate lyase activating enzyme
MVGTVFNIMRYAVNDGPGIRTTVFLKGCPLRCRWCHNPESILPGPELVLRGDRCIRCGACFDACEHGAVQRLDEAFVTSRKDCAACGRCVEVCPAAARELAGRQMTTGEVLAEIVRDTVFYDQSGGGATFSGGEPLLQSEFLLSLLEGCRGRAIHAAVDSSGYAPPVTLRAIAEATDLFLYSPWG